MEGKRRIQQPTTTGGARGGARPARAPARRGTPCGFHIVCYFRI